ncbi:MAG: hypothetical protein U5L45_24365 [Saprospiraceae bacterium]|nr:hypothetical protein [Saprospiraceae bacterium]
MDELIKLTKFLEKYDLKQADIIGSKHSESRYNEFYTLIKLGTIKSDNEAAQVFYGKKATGKSQAYRKMKRIFRERLIDTLFFINLNHRDFTEIESATMAIQKEWAAINIIFAKSDTNLAVGLAEELLPKALKYELTEIVVYITDRLKEGYGNQIGDIKKYTYYKILQKEQMLIWQAEIKAKDLFQQLRLETIRSAADMPHLAKIAEAGMKDLEHSLSKYKTFRLVSYGYFCKLAQFTASHKYDGALKVIDEAISILEQKPYNAQRVINIFLNQRIVCYMRMKDFEKGKLAALDVLALQPEGSIGWFKTLEYFTTIAFQTLNYDEAYTLYRRATENKGVNDLVNRNAEIWKLYKGYLFFFAGEGKIAKVTQQSPEFKDFKLSKFINDLVILGKDLEGMRISVLIIEAAIQLKEQKFGPLIDTVEALTKYRQRHLAKTHALYRYNLFIKMIGQLSREGFVRQSVKRATEVPYREMRKVPIFIDNNGLLTEIVPLEFMWEYILSVLKDK